MAHLKVYFRGRTGIEEYRTTAVMASPRPTRYAPRSQAFSPCRGSDPGSARKPRHRREPVPTEPATKTVVASALQIDEPRANKLPRPGRERLLCCRNFSNPLLS